MRGYFSCLEDFDCHTLTIIALVFEVALAVFSSSFAEGYFRSLCTFPSEVAIGRFGELSILKRGFKV